jgi:hypothetical protein
MAGMGPPPKHPGLRHPTNASRGASRRKHLPPEPPRTGPPKLPPHPARRAWHQLTRSWWRDLWASSIASQFSLVDEHGLRMIAVLRDAFWLDPQPALAGEIRLQEARFGLDVMSRRRLGWEMREEKPDQPARRARVEDREPDPRRVLSDPLRFLREHGRDSEGA